MTLKLSTNNLELTKYKRNSKYRVLAFIKIIKKIFRGT